MNKTIATLYVLGFLVPVNAYAMSSFPGQIQTHWQLSYTPECNLCHASSAGGGPVVQPFGQSMVAASLTVSGGSSLTNALDKLEADATDSDGDGVTDIEELKAGTSPNPDKTPIEYGCGGQIASHGATGWQATALGALAFLFFASRRNRNTNGNPS